MSSLSALVPVEVTGGIAVSVPDPVSIGEDSEQELVASPSRFITAHNVSYDGSQFSVALFAGHELSRGAYSLVEDAYSRLGYACDYRDSEIDAGANLRAVADNRVVGTLSVTLDSDRGIQAETLYSNEIAQFRKRGNICEFTRLAVDTPVVGREVLCSLFYVAYVYAHLVNEATDLFVEVNPRHASFYKRMLGFQQRGGVKLCPRVDAPAVLLHLDFRYTAMQIGRARKGLSVDSSQLYRHAAKASEEQLLVQRITAAKLL